MGTDTRLTKGGESLVHLEQAWQDRLVDGLTLHAAGRHGSAMALGLYSLEILLKAMVCRKLNLEHLPVGFQIHDLDGLVVLTGLSRLLNQKTTHRSALRRNWDDILLISRTLEELRYTPDSRWSKKQADTFFHQLNNPNHGVIPWLSSAT